MRSFFITPNVASSTMRPMPTAMPMPIIFHSRFPPMTPWASAEMSVACGAGSGFGAITPTFAAPANPYALASRLSTDGITAAPAPTPTISAICWRIGEAPTSCPVFRSCRLSFEIVAGKNDRGHEESDGDERRARFLGRRDGQGKHGRTRHDGQNPNARDRAVRCADEPGHVPADSRDQESDNQHERHRDERECHRAGREDG